MGSFDLHITQGAYQSWVLNFSSYNAADTAMTGWGVALKYQVGQQVLTLASGTAQFTYISGTVFRLTLPTAATQPLPIGQYTAQFWLVPTAAQPFVPLNGQITVTEGLIA